MGTSTACMFATLYYAFKETADYLEEFMQQESSPDKPMILYSRLIDDTIQIWDLDKLPAGITIHNLTKTIASKMHFGILEWEVDPPTRQANFLDLTITIEPDGSITTATYVKENNLHLYIHPHSAHSEGVVLKSLVFGNIQRYYFQNTHHSTFIKTTKDFFNHLLNRGYSKDSLAPLFVEAINNAESKAAQLSSSSSLRAHKFTGQQLYLHWEYHPTDVRRQQIQQVYKETLGPLLRSKLRIEKLTVAYSNPPNLRRCLTKTQLKEPEGERVSSLVEQLKQPSANR